jgi:Zn-finger nucleic acid-binding protein
MIVACSACDSRYDATGYSEGQQLRCRCGEMMTVHAPAPTAGLLACPQCGAGVSPNGAQCQYCSAQLLLKACPRCTSRVFHGYQHCPGCGAGLELAAAGTQRALPCPRCEVPLQGRLVGDVLVDECAKCFGLFLDNVAIQRLVTKRQQARADALLGMLPRAELKHVQAGGKMYVKCPSCANLMNRRLFATGAGVIVDVCRAHGTFFDVGELPVIIDFVMQGGLEKAARKELERERQRNRMQEQRLGLSPSNSLMSTTNIGSASSGSAFVDLLINLIS